MGHLVDYEEATTEKEMAFAALECSEAKSARARAWNWADIAVGHAKNCGITNAEQLLGNGRWPELDALKDALAAST